MKYPPYYIEGYLFIGTEEYEELKKRGGRKPWKTLHWEDFMKLHLHQMKLGSSNLDWSNDLPTGYDPIYLAPNLLILAEVQRRIDILLERPHKEISEYIIDGKIGECYLITDEQAFKLSKLIRPTKLDIVAQKVHKALKDIETSLYKNTIVSGNGIFEMYNIGLNKEKLPYLLLYRKEMERRIERNRKCKEYNWYLNKEGVQIGTWEKWM